MMTDRGTGIGRLVAALCALSLLAACGVKNDPVPLGSDKPSSVVSGAGTGTGVSRNSVSAVRGARIAGSSDDTITNAEVTRNPNATRKTFPLDALLN